MVAPLYDMGFDAIDGVALVRLGEYQHFITMQGQSLRRFPAQLKIKPLRERKALIHTAEGKEEIITLGELVKYE